MYLPGLAMTPKFTSSNWKQHQYWEKMGKNRKNMEGKWAAYMGGGREGGYPPCDDQSPSPPPLPGSYPTRRNC